MALKIYNNLFTGPFKVDEYIYKKNKRDTIIIFVEKMGKDYAPDRINEQALKFINDHKDKPFFLYYPTVIPHVALHVPDEELKPYLDQKWNDPLSFEQMDMAIRRILLLVLPMLL